MASRTDKPWGYELLWSHTEHYAGKVIHIEPGHRLSLQYHDHKHESILVIRGRLLLTLGADEHSRVVELGEGESADIPAGMVHRFEAPPDSSVDLIEVSTPQLDDVVRLADDYERA
jgi:mannose-6-phosphate isomerase